MNTAMKKKVMELIKKLRLEYSDREIMRIGKVLKDQNGDMSKAFEVLSKENQ